MILRRLLGYGHKVVWKKGLKKRQKAFSNKINKIEKLTQTSRHFFLSLAAL
jgi:hypothetical protein